MTSRPRRTRAGVVAAGLGLAALLAGCVPDLPEVQPDPEPTATAPVLDEPRLERVLAEIGDVIAEADEEDDAELLATRLEDPALGVRSAEYELRSATADTDEAVDIQPLTTESNVSIVAASDTWPRTVLVVTEIPDDANSPLLIGLRQEDPHAPYQMSSWVRLLPGVTMPETDVPEAGSAEVPMDSEDFFVGPSQAVNRYADVLTQGEDSNHADLFEEDPFRELVEQETDNLASNVDEAGEFEHTTERVSDATFAMATADGGLVVVGAMITQYDFTKTEEDGELEVGGQLAALAPDGGEVEESLTGTYDLMVAFYVPPESDDAQVTVLGVERVLSDVEQS